MRPTTDKLYLMRNKDTDAVAVVPIPKDVSDLGAHEACIALAQSYWGVPMQTVAIDLLPGWTLFELEGIRN